MRALCAFVAKTLLGSDGTSLAPAWIRPRTSNGAVDARGPRVSRTGRAAPAVLARPADLAQGLSKPAFRRALRTRHPLRQGDEHRRQRRARRVLGSKNRPLTEGQTYREASGLRTE